MGLLKGNENKVLVPKEKKEKVPKEKKVKVPKEKKEKVPKEKKVKVPKEKKEKIPKEKKIKEPKPGKTAKVTKAKKGNGSIMHVLMLTCIVPVILMVVLGVVSYMTASDAILGQATSSAEATVSAVADYTDAICNVVSSKAAEIVADTNVSNYYTKLYKDDGSTEATDALTNIGNLLTKAKQSNTYVQNYTIIPEGGTGTTTLIGTFPEDTWTTFSGSEEAQYFLKSGKIAGWRGYHEFADEYLLSNTASYGFAYYRKFMKNNTMLVMDISMDTVQNILIDMDMGEGSIKAMVSYDGREIGIEADKVTIGSKDSTIIADFYGLGTVDTPGQYFVGTWFYDQTKDSKETGSMDVEVDGKDYIYIYSPVGTTGIMICTLVPKDNLLEQTKSISYITAVLVIVAGLIALVLGSSIARGIRKTLKDVVKGLKKVGAGDLTVEFTTRRNDEFKQLTNDLNQTLTGIRGLIQDTRNFSEQVNAMSSDLATKTNDISESMNQVLIAVEEVSEGTQTQAFETENSNQKMINLAANLNDISAQTEVMEKMADNVMHSVENGNQIMEVLNQKSDTTAAITKTLSEEILEVEERSKQIQGIISVINGIAEQTNLLSLNASIEAARAGAAGRGFSVVAEEIRKLAEQSKGSANQIKQIVIDITETTNKTSESAKSAEAMMQEQAVALHDTVTIFQDIREATIELVQKLHVAGDGMEQIMKEKEDVGDSLQNIAAISEQAAASVEEINATLSQEMQTLMHLTEDADALKEQMEIMNSSMDKFQV